MIVFKYIYKYLIYLIDVSNNSFVSPVIHIKYLTIHIFSLDIEVSMYL